MLAVCGAHAENVRNEVQVFDSRHELVKIGVIGDIGNLPLARHGIFPHGQSVHGDLSRVGVENPDHGAQGCGLSRAVVSDKTVNFPRGDVQGEIVNR